MDGFYELLSDKLHLNEYHEYYYFTKKTHKLCYNDIKALEEFEHFDMRLFQFPGSDKIKRDAESEKYCLTYPPQLYFAGDFHNSKVERTDYPIIADYQLPVISKKLLSVMDSVKKFEHNVIPIVVFDFLDENPFIDNELRENIIRSYNYVYIKLFKFVLIDKITTNSFDKHTKHKWGFDPIKPEEGFDPIFRVRQLPERIFISEEAFNAINEYNAKAEDKIKGIRLYDGYDYISY